MYMYRCICICTYVFLGPLENPEQYNTERRFLRRWVPSIHSSTSWCLQCAKTSLASPYMFRAPSSTIFTFQDRVLRFPQRAKGVLGLMKFCGSLYS